MDETKDPKWKTSGAKNKKEYKFWANNICGMACLKMILEKELGIKLETITLAKKCLEYRGYKIENENNVNGLYYKEFVRFLSKEFDLQAKVYKRLSLRKIFNEVSKNNYVIASVSRYIRDNTTENIKRGGHLVLVVGYDRENQIIYIHNPSGYYPNKQNYTQVTFKNFKKCFAKRGVIVYKMQRAADKFPVHLFSKAKSIIRSKS